MAVDKAIHKTKPTNLPVAGPKAQMGRSFTVCVPQAPLLRNGGAYPIKAKTVG